MQGLKSLNVQFRTCPGKPKTFLRAIIRLVVEVLSVFGLFSGPKSIFIVIFYVRDFELNMCDEAQINLKIRKKAPENVGLLFYRPSHFIKTRVGARALAISTFSARPARANRARDGLALRRRYVR